MQLYKPGINLHLRSRPCLHSHGRICKTGGGCSSAWQKDTGFPASPWAYKTVGYLWELPAGPLSLLGSSAVRQASLPCQQRSSLPLFCTSPQFFFLGEVLGPGQAPVAGKEEHHWWALQVSCQSSHSSTCSCLTWKRVIFSIMHIAAAFSHIFVVGSGILFLLFFLKGEKKEKCEFARYVTDPAFGGWRWFVSNEKPFVRQTADLLTVPLVWCQL